MKKTIITLGILILAATSLAVASTVYASEQHSAATFIGPIDFSGTTNSGLQVNSLTTTQRDALAAAANGMVIYNSTLSQLQGYISGSWATLSTSGGTNENISGWLRVGSASAPSNTTAGDITGVRLNLGNAAAMSTTLGNVIRTDTTNTDTAAQTDLSTVFVETITPTSTSAAQFRNLYVENIVNPATTIGFTDSSGIQGAFLENRIRTDGTIVASRGQVVRAIVVDSSSLATATITTAVGFDSQIYARPSGTTIVNLTTGIGYDTANLALNAGLTATTLTGFRMVNPAANTITNLIGMDIAALTRGTNNIGLRVAAPSGGSANYAIQLSDTGGTAAGGITFGTDTTLYRSAASTLKTDGALSVTGTSTLATTSITGTLSVTGSTTISSLGTGCVNSTSVGALYVASCAVGTVTGSGTNGQVSYWTGTTALSGSSKLLFDGTVFGFNATSSTIGFNIQGTAGSNSPFTVASSTGTTLFSVSASGDILLDGVATKTVQVASSTTGVGVGLTIAAGSASTSSTNLAGGNLTLKSGIGTGSGAGSGLIAWVSPSGSSGTATESQLAVLQLFKTGTANGTGIQLTLNNTTVGAVTGINLSGQAAQALQLQRITTANTAGNNLTVGAGGATSAATNKAGGNLILASGISTGSGTGNVQLQTTFNASAASASTTDNSLITRMTIDSNGNVGIGSTSPNATLVVEGTSTSPTLDIFQVATSTNSILLDVLSSGNVGINTTTPAYKFVVAGTVQLPNLTTSAGLQTGVLCVNAANEVINDSVACLASARRFKTEIKPLSVGLSELLKLNPVEFKWTKEFNQGFENDPNKNGVQYSLVADDVQRIDSKLATVETSGKNKGQVHGLADFNHWVALFVQSFKDMEKQIVGILKKDKEQDAKLTKFQHQIDKQQKEIDLLQKQVKQLMKK